MNSSPTPMAAAVLRSTLEGLDELLTRTAVFGWPAQVREVAAIESPSDQAHAYELMSRGSASGTFHDLTISEFNRHAVTEIQEPYVGALLDTLQSLGIAAARAITLNGDEAILPEPTAEAAARYAFASADTPSRRRILVTGLRCTTCGTGYQLDVAPYQVAGRHWALTTAPEWVEVGRARDLVSPALDPLAHKETRAELETVLPAFEQLGLPVIRLPYNRPRGEPDDRCQICGADTWGPTLWDFLDNPPRLEPHRLIT
jgi:hypothetical protein